MIIANRKFVCAIVMACLLPAWSAAQESSAAGSTDNDFAYKVQGEYLGQLAEENAKVGVQVIALGKGEFRAVAHLGGLPGAGWSRDQERHDSNGKRDGDTVVFRPPADVADDAGVAKAVIKDGVLTVYDANDNELFQLEKIERKSPTLGKAAPEGAMVLFDGSNVDAWENAKLVDGNLLGATNCYTKQKFGDHQLHIEFRTPFMPEARGQGRGNSGVYMQSRYELQVLDSFGLEGENNECGGIYSIAKPAVNMCYPPMTWQTYDIDFTAARYDESGKKTQNARATIRHNGVVIHDNLELTHGTPGRHPEGPGPEALFLQDHGNPVVFRNIWVVEK